jgi:hypothetical protein
VITRKLFPGLRGVRDAPEPYRGRVTGSEARFRTQGLADSLPYVLGRKLILCILYDEDIQTAADWNRLNRCALSRRWDEMQVGAGGRGSSGGLGKRARSGAQKKQ